MCGRVAGSRNRARCVTLRVSVRVREMNDRPIPKRIAAWAGAALVGLVATPGPTFAAAPLPGGTGADPVGVAGEVFQDPAFWWKRIEPRSVSTSWLESLLRPVGDLVGRILEYLGDLIARILSVL